MLLIETSKSGADFWKIIKSVSGSKNCINKISTNEWKIYFSNLLNINNITDNTFDTQIKTYTDLHDTNYTDCKDNTDSELVNKFISIAEIECAITDTISSKAPGIDGIT